MYKLLFVSVLCLFTFSSLSQQKPYNTSNLSLGTTIIAFLSPDTAWLSADTKLLEVEIGTKDTTALKATKIYKNKNTYYGFCGIGDFNSTDFLSFEPKNILDSLLLNKRPLAETDAIFNGIVFSKANKIAEWLFKYSKKEYVENIGKAIFSYILLGYENDNLKCFSTVFEINSMPLGHNRVREVRHDVYEGDTTLFFLGYVQEVRQMIASGQHRFNIKNVKNELACLIEKEANIHQSVVGMPVDEFIVYRNGFKFLPNLECPISLPVPKNPNE